MALQNGRLRVMLRLSEPLEAKEACSLYLHPLTRGRVEPPQRYSLEAKTHPRGVSVKVAGRFMEVSLPWKREASGVILGVEVTSPKRPAGRMPWLVLVGS